MDVDEGTTGQLPRRNFQSSPQPLSKIISEIQADRIFTKLPKSLYHTVVEVLMENEDVQWLLFIFYATAVLLDYLFVYIPVIDHESKCIRLDNSLGIIAVVYRMALDLLFIIIIFSTKLKFTTFKLKLPQEGVIKCLSNTLLDKEMRRKDVLVVLVVLLLHQFINILLFSPIVQVLVLIIITSEGKERLIFPAINTLLGLHLPRLAAVIKLLLITRRSASSRFSTKLAYLFAFIYIYSSQLFAALWYVLSIYKETQCWEIASKKYGDVRSYNHNIYNCNNISKDYNKYVSDYCSNNTTRFDFGIYDEVHRSGILEKKSTMLRMLYFSRWGLQNLSSFAQGLKAGVDVSGNIFVIFIMVSGVIMFFFLIGEVQCQREILVKMKQKLQEAKQWMTCKELPQDLQSQVKKHQKYAWQETKGTDANVENLFNDLPKDLRRKVTHRLCIELLKKVEEFEKWSEASLMELCDYVKPLFFVERTRIIREGDPIDEMIFVVQGTLWTYTKVGSLSITNYCNSENDHLKDGGFYGRELVNWVQADPYTSNLPISTRTIQAVTNVEAFVLMGYDLRKIYIKKYKAILFIQLYWRFRRALRLKRNTQIPT